VHSLKISVVTVVFNGESIIRSCLESVRRQSVSCEHIVVDGDSKDGTLRIVEEYRNDSVVVLSEPDGGIYDAMNKGLRLASGDIIGILNSDDLYSHERVLEKVRGVFEHGDADACYGDLIYVDSANSRRVIRYWRAGEFHPTRMYWGWMPPHPTFFVRKEVYEKCGNFRLDLGTAADYELTLRFLLKKRVRVKYLPEVLVNMRIGGRSNACIINRFRANRYDRLAWEVNGLRPYPWTLICKPIRKMRQYFVGI
jgi:glycosyltransferase involved in cell wall biosynthesis